MNFKNPQTDMIEAIELECEHGDIDQDERVCLDCGKDMTEELMSRFDEDAWKDWEVA